MNDGGPAFPRPASTRPHSTADECFAPHDGISTRDYFAAKALGALISNGQFGAELQRMWDPDKRVAEAGNELESPQEYVARLCFEFADAMLAERERTNER